KTGINLGLFYYVLLFFIITGTSNGVNLTDGLDGLAAGTVTIVMLVYSGIAFKQGNLDLAIFCAAIGGACVGFIWYNSFPAEIFMGDTGSLGLGGAIAAMSILTKTEILLVLIGGIYVIETLSVIAQVVSFRYFGKRVLKMAPIHHHFELLGWSETKVMVRFWIVSGVLAAGGFAFFFMDYLRGGK
ncbi:MAG: phospho-N-acetylmuramoyl-pentapeptide-transferase, partial [Actinobacteria bacterium]|nr:phospho-N-acetylmuramoyl-pentapeptide-transferase [Actinomycetota bacterium]